MDCRQPKTIIAVIPARAGSKRIPHKNTALLGGKPLIQWTIDEALKTKSLTDIIVSSDDPLIEMTVKEYKNSRLFMMEFPRRVDLCEDVDTSLVLQHELALYEKNWVKVDLVVLLQPTSPFRLAEDIEACVELALFSGLDTILSVRPALEHPGWMLTKDKDQNIVTVFGNELRGDKLISQNLEPFSYPNGAVYVTKRDFIAKGQIFGDKLGIYHMPLERSLDIEEPIDLKIAEALLKH